MDPNAGRFVEEDRAEQWMQRIAVGETHKILGEELEVVRIEGREITLKLLSFEERLRQSFDSPPETIEEMRKKLVDGQL